MVFLADFYFKGQLFLVFGAVDWLYFRESRADVLSQILSIFAASVNQNNMRRLYPFYKLRGLSAIGMGGKADFLHW